MSAFTPGSDIVRRPHVVDGTAVASPRTAADDDVAGHGPDQSEPSVRLVDASEVTERFEELEELSASADPRVTATHRATRYRSTLLVGDVVLLLVAAVFGGAVLPGGTVTSRSGALDGLPLSVVAAGATLVWMALLFALSGYARSRLETGTEEFGTVLLTGTITAGALAGFAYLTWTNVPRDFFATYVVAGTSFLLVWRYGARRAVRALRRREAYVVPTVVLGTRAEVERVLVVLERESWAGYAVQGLVVTDDEEVEEVLGHPVLATGTAIVPLLELLETQTLIIASTGGIGGMGVRRLMWQLEESDIEVAVAPYFNDLAGSRVNVQPVAGLPLLQLRQPDFTGPQRILKRALGLVLSSLLLVAFAPVLAVIAVLVRRSSPGPVLFRQARVGRHGEEFTCLKFRTMYVDAEARLHELHQRSDGNELLFKMKHDPRVTPVGQVLRRFSLDELPQLVNVFRGEMALVGPRPPLPSEVVQYSSDLRRRLAVPPGMTGLWQVSGRSDLSLHESTRLDLYYVDNWSLLLDLDIVMRTVGAVVSGRGAY